MRVGLAGQILNLLVEREAPLKNIQRAGIFTHIAVSSAQSFERQGLITRAIERFGYRHGALAPLNRLPIAALALERARSKIEAARQFQTLCSAGQRQRAL